MACECSNPRSDRSFLLFLTIYFAIFLIKWKRKLRNEGTKVLNENWHLAE